MAWFADASGWAPPAVSEGHGGSLWVCSCFVGDEDMVLAWKQHDVYGRALGAIVSACNRYASFAKVVLADTGHDEWGTIETFDHRVLQGGHDLLAAAWRYGHDSRQGVLPFEGSEHTPSSELLWLDWLQTEVSAWIDEPQLVRSVQLALTNQNRPIGYLAEAQMGVEIMFRFSNVPWNESLRDAYWKNLEMRKEEVGATAAAPEAKD